MAVVVQREEGVVTNLPNKTLRVHEIAAIPTPGGFFSWSGEFCAGRDGFGQCRIDIGFAGNVVCQRKTGEAAPLSGNLGVFSQRLALIQGKTCGADLEKGDVFLAAC